MKDSELEHLKESLEILSIDKVTYSNRLGKTDPESLNSALIRRRIRKLDAAIDALGKVILSTKVRL